MKCQKSKRVRYFRKQKALGAVLALLGVISAIVLDGDITVALLFVPIGLYIMFTKDLVLLDDYFYKAKETNEEL